MLPKDVNLGGEAGEGLLDCVLAHYGPETREVRELLRHGVAAVIQQVWPEEQIGTLMVQGQQGGGGAEAVENKLRQQPSRIEKVQDQLRQMTPKTDAQRSLQDRALRFSGDIAEGRWLLIEQMGQSSLPRPFLIILIFWLLIIFATFGLFSPRNTMVVVVFLICAVSVAGSLYLIMELDNPYGGLIKVTSAPLRQTLALLRVATYPH